MQRFKELLKWWAIGFCCAVTVAVVILVAAVLLRGQETLNIKTLLGVVVLCALVAAAAVFAYGGSGLLKNAPYSIRSGVFTVLDFAMVLAVAFLFKWDTSLVKMLHVGAAIFIAEAIMVIAQWRFRRAGKGYDVALGLYKNQKKGNGR